jgi:hypothetical protein
MWYLLSAFIVITAKSLIHICFSTYPSDVIPQPFSTTEFLPLSPQELRDRQSGILHLLSQYSLHCLSQLKPDWPPQVIVFSAVLSESFLSHILRIFGPSGVMSCLDLLSLLAG